MRANINTSLLSQLVPKDKPYDVRDKNLTGFLVRVNISGKMLYMCQYARGKRVTIGKVEVLTPAQARDKAKEILADAVRGIAPASALKAPNKMTFASYIENFYKPWVESNRKEAKEEIDRVRVHFLEKLGDKLLTEINPLPIEQWRTQRLKKGIKPNTLNRDIASLKAAISKAVEWELIDTHPLAKLKLLKIDHYSKLRYLTIEEERRLRNVLDDREDQLKLKRESGNAWRSERGYPTMGSIVDTFANYMKPMILLSLNTGIRQGELFSLNWNDIDFTRATLTVRGESSKSGKTRHIPLNNEALTILKKWHQQAKTDGFIFPNKNNQRLNNVKKAWSGIREKAQISEFRWHDMRHHFASSLVMVGVDLNTVRELLGHSDTKMTLRYAHLAPEHKANAVAKLNQAITIEATS